MLKSRLLAVVILLTLASLACAAPKNIIVMIADGCGFNQIEAASLYQFGRPDGWAYQQFPVKYAMSTFPSGGSYDPAVIWSDFLACKQGATDSAAAATALATGVKTYNGAIGVGPDKQPVKNVLERAEEVGKATGVITTVPFSHATPAGFLAHNEGRGNYCEIANSMLCSRAEVVMGAGNPFYDNSSKLRPEPKYEFVGEPEWTALKAGTLASDADGDGQLDTWKLLQARADFQALATGEAPHRVCGIPMVASTLQEDRGGDVKADAYAVPFNENVPTLVEMVMGAFNVLDADPDGFTVMIEGGAVDFAGHSNLSGRSIEEESDFSRTVEAVIAWIEKNGGWDQNLLIVTGDHETGYLTGPGSGPGPNWAPLVNNGQGKMPGMQWNYGSHTNNLIALFARGAGSEAFAQSKINQDPRRGAYVDNTDVARVVFKALK
ncbi:MAG: alkaline phosphatase [Armatimonadia bacterium]